MDPDAITYLKFMKRFAKGFYRFHVQVICRFIKNEEVRTVKKKNYKNINKVKISWPKRNINTWEHVNLYIILLYWKLLFSLFYGNMEHTHSIQIKFRYNTEQLLLYVNFLFLNKELQLKLTNLFSFTYRCTTETVNMYLL